MTEFNKPMLEHLNEKAKTRLAHLHRLAQDDKLLLLNNPWTWQSLIEILDSILAQLKAQMTETPPPTFGEGTRSDD